MSSQQCAVGLLSLFPDVERFHILVLHKENAEPNQLTEQ